jgi:hypothetical protein
VTATRIALWWVDRYTTGVPGTERAERRAEITSDLWEQRAATPPGLGTELSVLSRCLRGMPADLAWRRSRRRGRRLPSGRSTLRFAGWTLALLAYLFLAGVHGYSATPLIGLDLYGGDWAPGDVDLYARISAALLLLLLAGAALLRRTPRLAVAVLAAATIGTCVAFWWAAAVYAPVGLMIVAAAVALARRRRQRASSATS